MVGDAVAHRVKGCDAVEEVARGDGQGVVDMSYSTAQGIPGKGRLPRRVGAVIDAGQVLDSGHRRSQCHGNMAWHVYILRCADGKLYIGSTGDLSQRLADHCSGRSRWTAARLPVELVYYESCETLAQARQRERSLKNGRTRRKKIDQMIAAFPAAKIAPFA